MLSLKDRSHFPSGILHFTPMRACVDFRKETIFSYTCDEFGSSNNENRCSTIESGAREYRSDVTVPRPVRSSKDRETC
jgi:hypothetical protein